MVDQSSVPATKPPNRLEALGHRAARRKPEGGPKELTARHRLLVDYQINGCPHRDVLRRITRKRAVLDETGQPVIRDVSPEPGEPLTLIEAADLLRIRRRNARELSSLPIYRSYMAGELRRFREGEHIASVRTLVEIRDEPGLNKAADRKVRAGAAMALLGEEGRSSTNVTINNNVGTQLTAGIVIDLRDDDEVEREMRTIEHGAVE